MKCHTFTFFDNGERRLDLALEPKREACVRVTFFTGDGAYALCLFTTRVLWRGEGWVDLRYMDVVVTMALALASYWLIVGIK
jgi:hypothetical protein